MKTITIFFWPVDGGPTQSFENAAVWEEPEGMWNVQVEGNEEVNRYPDRAFWKLTMEPNDEPAPAPAATTKA
jgi:hypothetical protein